MGIIISQYYLCEQWDINIKQIPFDWIIPLYGRACIDHREEAIKIIY